MLRVYNAKPEAISDADFCKRYQIKVRELSVWQRLAGDELELRLKEMRAVEKTVIKGKGKFHSQFDSRVFVHKCAKVIGLAGGGRLQVEMAQSKSFYRFELARYKLLQKITSLPSSD